MIIILHFFLDLIIFFNIFLSIFIKDIKFILKISCISLSFKLKKSFGLFFADTKIILSGVKLVLKFSTSSNFPRSKLFELISKILSLFKICLIFFPISPDEPKMIVFFF